MNILVIGHSLVVDANRKLYAQLCGFGHNVDLIVPRKWKSNLIRHLEYNFNPEIDEKFSQIMPIDCFIQGNGSFYFFHFLQLYHALNSKKYDIIIVLQETWSMSLTQINILRFISKSSNSNFYIFPNQNIKKKKFLFLLPLEYFNCMGLTRILYPTEGVREVIEWKGIKNKCSLFSYTYDSESFLRKKENLSDVIKIGYLGRITEEKGLYILLDAFKKLKKIYPKVSLKIAGNGDLASLFKNESDIDYLGVIPHAKAYEFYQDLDIFVLPSQTRPFWKEQFGRVLIEAAASGNLVIGSSSGAIPEVLSKIEMPFCFDESSSNDLCIKLKDCISKLESGDSKKIIDRAISNCTQMFSHKSVAGVLNNYFIEDFS